MRKITTTKESTRKLLVGLEKQGKKTGKSVWTTLSDDLRKPRRKRRSVNLWQLERSAKKAKGKILVVPGKVLGNGELNVKAVSISAFEFSPAARKKIEGAGSSALTLYQLLEKKPKEDSLVIVG